MAETCGKGTDLPFGCLSRLQPNSGFRADITLASNWAMHDVRSIPIDFASLLRRIEGTIHFFEIFPPSAAKVIDELY
jgi:hypothetical protein